MEETGYRVLDRGQMLSVYHNVEASPRDHVALFVFKEFEQARQFAPNAEIAEMGWFPLDDLPTDTTDATRRRIGEYFGGIAIDEIW